MGAVLRVTALSPGFFFLFKWQTVSVLMPTGQHPDGYMVDGSAFARKGSKGLGDKYRLFKSIGMITLTRRTLLV